MKHRQLSVATAMAGIGYLAIGFATLKAPTPLRVSLMFSLAVALLAVSVLGAVYRRAFWLGFAVVGAGYLLLVFGPWVDTRLGSRLVSTTLIDRLYSDLKHIPKTQYEDVWWSNSNGFYTGYMSEIDDQSEPPIYKVTTSEGATIPIPVSLFRSIDVQSYRILGHSFVCPILAFLGGIVARQFAMRKI